MTAATFQQRLTLLARKRHRMEAAGVVYRLRRDGLITAEPRRKGPRAGSLRVVALLALGLVTFKAALFTVLGEEAYGARVAALQAGSAVERAGAWVMQADPATRWAARVLQDLGA